MSHTNHSISDNSLEIYDDEFLEGEFFGDEELQNIAEEYRRKRLIESLIGPIISTVFHVILIIVLSILIKDQHRPQVTDIEVTMETVEEVVLEEPPPIEEPIPEKLETKETTNPVLTTVKIDNVDTNDTALEDTNDDAPSTDDNMMDQAVSDVVVSPSAFASANVYGGRSASGRAAAVSKFGGNAVGQNAVIKALWWLAKVQNPDGSWGEHDQDAMTGLALLTFLAHGETPTSKHFGKNVRRAMEWLSKSPTEGKIGVYNHAIKAYALAEAYAMTGVSILEDSMNKAIRMVIDGMQKGGSYNYGYRLDENQKQDLSVAGWNYQALKAAYGAGCEEPGLQEAIYRAIEWLKKHAVRSDTGNGFPYAFQDGAYRNEGKHTMRAVGVLCLQLFGEGRYKGITDEINVIATQDLAKLNWNNAPNGSLYGWYYATQAMFQHGGKEWKAWNRKFQKELTDNQHKEGYWVYPSNFHFRKKPTTTVTAKIYATTLCALQLTVYYRYLPSSKGAIGNGKDAKNPEKKVIEEEAIDLVE